MCGVIAGGSDNGTITLWAADKIIKFVNNNNSKGSHYTYVHSSMHTILYAHIMYNVLLYICSGTEGAQLKQMIHHTGPVRTIDFNPFQPNLLASGAGESEIFIWDLNDPDNPMSPGNKLHPLEDISGVAWNRQVLLLKLAPVAIYSTYIHGGYYVH